MAYIEGINLVIGRIRGWDSGSALSGRNPGSMTVFDSRLDIVSAGVDLFLWGNCCHSWYIHNRHNESSQVCARVHGQLPCMLSSGWCCTFLFRLCMIHEYCLEKIYWRWKLQLKDGPHLLTQTENQDYLYKCLNQWLLWGTARSSAASNGFGPNG